MNYFVYGKEQIEHLKARDKKLGKVIDEKGYINREVIPDLFEGLISSIISQQISGKAAKTVKRRFYDFAGVITPENIAKIAVTDIQKQGMSMRKANYIKTLAQKITSGEFDPEKIKELPDNEVIKALTVLPGIGVWTAEMLMIFSMQRQNILSNSDLGIRRGMSGLYNLETFNNEVFEYYRKIYSPYASVASLYLWELSSALS